MYENLRFCSLLILGFSHFKSNHEPLYHIHTHQSVHPFESPFSCLEFGPLTLTLETQAQPANQVLLHQLYKETQEDRFRELSDVVWNTYTLNLDKEAAEVSLKFTELYSIHCTP